MFGLPTPTPMNTDPSHVEVLLPNDDRLIAGIDAVVAHAGARAGLSGQEQAELARATTEACDKTFSLATRSGNAYPILRVLISDFPNRVEVSIEDSGAKSDTAPNQAGCESANELDAVTASLQGMKTDRLHHEGRPRTVLVKHHAGATSTR
jgi:anti-sigma regulatory factor (Ser/Thr protein kinase)